MSKNRNIFEDKQNNGMQYIGQKPCRVTMIPEDTSDATYGIIDHKREQDMGVKHVRNAGDTA